MRRGVRRLVMILAIAVVVAALGGVAYYRYREKLTLAGKLGGPGAKEDQSVDTSVPAAVYRAKVAPISESLLLSGEVVPLTDVSIFSTVTGKVEEILVSEGDRVERDAVLGYIDRSEAGLTFSPTPVESTITGVVEEVLAERGEYITPTVPLFRVIDMDVVEVVVRIPERDIERVKRGLSAEVGVVSYPGRTFRGRVERLSPVVDPLSRSREVRIRIDNADHALKPGMFGDVRIIIRTVDVATVIPLAAVIERGGRQVVFLAESGRARAVEPLLDIRSGRWVSVSSGIEPGDRVVVIGQQNLEEGDRVNVTEELGDEDI
jgi:membrane fusion protein (multidrug efflux system)